MVLLLHPIGIGNGLPFLSLSSFECKSDERRRRRRCRRRERDREKETETRQSQEGAGLPNFITLLQQPPTSTKTLAQCPFNDLPKRLELNRFLK